MRIPLALRLPLLVSLAALGACSAPRLDVIARMQQSQLDGTLGAETTGVSTTGNDVDDLGLGDTENELGARADLSFGPGKWTFAWSPASFSGDGTLTADITHDGTTIPAGTAVTSDLTMNVGTGLWTFDFVPGDNLELALGLGAHLLDFDGMITDGTDTVALDESIPVPVLAARAGVVFGDFDVSALVSGLQFKDGTDEATFFDADVMGRWRFIGGVDGHLAGSVVVGWHGTDVELDYTDGADHVDADLKVSGFYFGLGIGF